MGKGLLPSHTTISVVCSHRPQNSGLIDLFSSSKTKNSYLRIEFRWEYRAQLTVKRHKARRQSVACGDGGDRGTGLIHQAIVRSKTGVVVRKRLINTPSQDFYQIPGNNNHEEQAEGQKEGRDAGGSNEACTKPVAPKEALRKTCALLASNW